MRTYLIGKKYKLSEECKKEIKSLANCDFIICEDFCIDGLPKFSYHGDDMVNKTGNCGLTSNTKKHEKWVIDFESKQPEEWL